VCDIQQSVTYDDKLPHQVIALLNRLLAKDPAERMGIKDIKLDSWFLQDRAAAAAADAGADAAVCVMVSEVSTLPCTHSRTHSRRHSLVAPS